MKIKGLSITILIMEITDFLNGFLTSLFVLSETLLICTTFVWNKIMSLETAAQVATIIAVLIASGAIINWFKDKIYRKKPFRLDSAIFSRLRHVHGSAYFRVIITNRYSQEIQVRSVRFLGETRFEVSQISGGRRFSQLNSVIGGDQYYRGEDLVVIAPGAEHTFLIEFDSAEEAERIKDATKVFNLSTNRGEYIVNIPEFTVWTTSTGHREYLASTTCRIKHWLDVLQYYTWSISPRWLKNKLHRIDR